MKTKQEWKRIIKRWEDSGLSQSEFCRRENIPSSSFHTNKIKLKNIETSDSFVDITPNGLGKIEVSTKQGVTIKLPSNISSQQLAEIVKCLG